MDFFAHSFDADFCFFFFSLTFLVLCMTILFLFGRRIDKYFPIDVIAIYIATNEQNKKYKQNPSIIAKSSDFSFTFFFTLASVVVFGCIAN